MTFDLDIAAIFMIFLWYNQQVVHIDIPIWHTGKRGQLN